jgi:hypothetical protein
MKVDEDETCSFCNQEKKVDEENSLRYGIHYAKCCGAFMYSNLNCFRVPFCFIKHLISCEACYNKCFGRNKKKEICKGVLETKDGRKVMVVYVDLIPIHIEQVCAKELSKADLSEKPPTRHFYLEEKTQREIFLKRFQYLFVLLSPAFPDSFCLVFQNLP